MSVAAFDWCTRSLDIGRAALGCVDPEIEISVLILLDMNLIILNIVTNKLFKNFTLLSCSSTKNTRSCLI